MVHRCLDLEFLEDAVGGEIRRCEQRIGLVPDVRRAAFVEQFVNAEVTLQFEVCPVVERIAKGVADGLRPRGNFS